MNLIVIEIRSKNFYTKDYLTAEFRRTFYFKCIQTVTLICVRTLQSYNPLNDHFFQFYFFRIFRLLRNLKVICILVIEQKRQGNQLFFLIKWFSLQLVFEIKKLKYFLKSCEFDFKFYSIFIFKIKVTQLNFLFSNKLN